MSRASFALAAAVLAAFRLGVIATDPIGYGQPEAVVTYVDEIKKVAGGQPIKQERLMQVKDPHTVLADETMDWEKLVPGHLCQPGGRLGTKKDVQDLSAAVKPAAQAGECWDGVEKGLKLPKYETWPGYETGLPMVLRRYCGLWGRGT